MVSNGVYTASNIANGQADTLAFGNFAHLIGRYTYVVFTVKLVICD